MFANIAARILGGGTPLGRQEALSILATPHEELLTLVNAAYQLRRHYFGNRVHIHVLENAKLGDCPEDCSFCSQSSAAGSPSGEAPIKTVEALVAGADRAAAARAKRYCMVTATHGPSARDLDTICEAARIIKEKYPLSLCASLGFLTEAKAKRLKEAGIDRFNHNIETSERHFPEVVTTHSFSDRVDTLKIAKGVGLETCAGGIVGLGENDDDLVDMAMTLRELDVDSIPVNFLDPRPGTPLAGRTKITPQQAVKALCLFRFAHPSADVRIAGGREVTLRHLSVLALYPANSLFSSGYLTTDGATPTDDWQLISDAGFEIETELPQPQVARQLPVLKEIHGSHR